MYYSTVIKGHSKQTNSPCASFRHFIQKENWDGGRICPGDGRILYISHSYLMYLLLLIGGGGGVVGVEMILKH